MKKIYSKFCLLCRALVLLLLLAVLTPNNLSAQTAGRQIPNYITLNSPFPDSTLTWTAPLGAYKIFKIEIAGDGGDGGAGISIGQTDLKGGKGGDGALISDITNYTLSVPSLRSLEYEYTSGPDGYRKVIFNSKTYSAGNGKNGGDASDQGPSGTPGSNGEDYTFYTNDSAYVNNCLYWFDENGKLLSVQHFNAAVKVAPKYTVNFNFNGGGATCNDPYSDTFADTTYVFGRPIVRLDDPFKCGHLFMDWRHGVDSFTVDSFKNVRSGISEATGETVENEAFGIRSNMVLDAAWKYFITIEGLRDTAVVANYSLCEINTRDYVWEPTEDKRPYCYTYHKDYLGHEYRYYIPGENGNCDVRFGDSVYLESPKILPVGQTPQVTWTVTDMCGTPFTLTQNVNVMFPPCGTDNYDPAESAYDRVNNNHGSLDGEYLASIDGKDDYRTVRIGCNCWLKENLQNENYADGSSIAIAKAYLNDETKVPEFGRLYTWYSAVNVPEGDDNTQPATANETITFSQTSNTYSRDYVQGVCPDGWHIPALAEYQNLKDLVGTANAIKAVGGNYWLGYQDATDAAEFTGVPGGYYDNTTDRYYNILGKAYFWSTENYGVKALPCSLLYGCPEILFNEQNKYLVSAYAASVILKSLINKTHENSII